MRATDTDIQPGRYLADQLSTTSKAAAIKRTANGSHVTSSNHGMTKNGDRGSVQRLCVVGSSNSAVVPTVPADQPCVWDTPYADPAGHLPSDTRPPVDREIILCNLQLFIWLKIIGSFDSGAFSAALGAPKGITEEWALSAKMQGKLTSSVFLGNVLGCPLAGHLFSHYSEKRVMVAALIVQTIFTFLFAVLPIYGVALVNRFFIGISLSFIVVYTPVWIDEFAPKDRQSIWMASHNAGVPLGIMLGYVVAASLPTFANYIGWSWSFYIKCALMVPTIAYVARLDSRSINTRKPEGSGDNRDGGSALDQGRVSDTDTPSAGAAGGESTVETAHTTTVSLSRWSSDTRRFASTGAFLITPCNMNASQFLRKLFDRLRATTRGFYSSMRPLLSSVVYMCSVVSLTSLYFVATGLQNFVTQYLRAPPFNASMTVIMIGFGSAVVSAPVCGVIVGGILLDRVGGYKGNLRRVSFFLLTWGLCAVIFSIICIFVRTTRGFLLVISVVLFCGGAIIPPGAGLTMASLPDHLRSTGAAFSQTLYNLLGNFSGPLVCGWVTETTGSLRYGIMTLLLSSALGVIPITGILYVAYCSAGGGDAGGGATEAAIVYDEDVNDLEMHHCGDAVTVEEAGGTAVVVAPMRCGYGDERDTEAALRGGIAPPNGKLKNISMISSRSGAPKPLKAVEVEPLLQQTRQLAADQSVPSCHQGTLVGNDTAAASRSLPSKVCPPTPSGMPILPAHNLAILTAPLPAAEAPVEALTLKALSLLPVGEGYHYTSAQIHAPGTALPRTTSHSPPKKKWSSISTVAEVSIASLPNCPRRRGE